MKKFLFALIMLFSSICLMITTNSCEKDEGRVDAVIEHVDGTWGVILNDTANEGTIKFDSFSDLGETFEMNVKRGSADEFGSYPFGNFSSTINPNELYLSFFKTADDIMNGSEVSSSLYLYPIDGYNSYRAVGLPLYEKDNIKLIKQFK